MPVSAVDVNPDDEKIEEKKEASGFGEAGEPPHEFWLDLMKTEYKWMKQVRPLKRLWGQREKIKEDLETLRKTAGIQREKFSGQPRD